MTATNDVLDLVRRWAAAEQQNDAGQLDGLLTDDFVGVGPLGFGGPGYLAERANSPATCALVRRSRQLERQAATTVSRMRSAPQCLGRKAKAPAARTASADSSLS